MTSKRKRCIFNWLLIQIKSEPKDQNNKDFCGHAETSKHYAVVENNEGVCKVDHLFGVFMHRKRLHVSNYKIGYLNFSTKNKVFCEFFIKSIVVTTKITSTLDGIVDMKIGNLSEKYYALYVLTSSSTNQLL